MKSENQGTETVDEIKPPEAFFSQIALTSLFAFAGYAATGTGLAALSGAALFWMGRNMGRCVKKAFALDDQSESMNYLLAANALLLASVFVAGDGGDFFNAYDRWDNPREYTKKRLMCRAAQEIADGDNGMVQVCEDVYAFRPFGQRGPETGEVCLSMIVEQRHGMNFTARLKYNDEAKEKLKAFRPGGLSGLRYSLPFMAPAGYEDAYPLEKPPEP